MAWGRGNSGFVVLIAGIAGLIGCGGSGGGMGVAIGTNTGSTGGISGSTPRAQALRDISKVFQGLPHQDLTTDNNSLAAYLKTRSDIKTEGISSDGTVWANFTDGSGLLITTNREVEPSLRGAAAASTFGRPRKMAPRVAPVQMPIAVKALQTRGDQDWTLPTAKKVFLYDAFGENSSPFADDPRVVALNTQDWLDGALGGAGYSVIPLDGTISTLKSAQNLDVLYIDSHGGTGANLLGDTFYGLGSSVPVTDANTTALSADIALGRVGYLLAPSLVDPGSFASGYRLAAEYYITAGFVQQYMSFKERSMVVINACSSMTDPNFISAFYGKGASTYIGWNGVTTSYNAAESAEYLFDRLLGANMDTAYMPSPPQRAFAVDDVFGNDMDIHNRTGKTYALSHSTSWGVFKADLDYSTNPALSSSLIPPCGILAPTISGFLLTAGGTATNQAGQDQLELQGIFGYNDTGQAYTVTVGGTPIETTWDNRGLDLSLSNTAGGDVVVNCNGAKSNPIQLTSWRGQMTMDFPGQGTELATSNWGIHVRGVLNALRVTPETTPVSPLYGGNSAQLVTAKDTMVSFTASGSYSDSTTSTIWSLGGPGGIPYYQTLPVSGGGATTVVTIAEPNPNQPLFYFGFDEGSASGSGILEVTTDKQTGVITPFTAPFGTNGYLYMAGEPMGSTFGLMANTWKAPSGVVTVSWPGIPATNPPDPTGAQ